MHESLSRVTLLHTGRRLGYNSIQTEEPDSLISVFHVDIPRGIVMQMESGSIATAWKYNAVLRKDEVHTQTHYSGAGPQLAKSFVIASR